MQRKNTNRMEKVDEEFSREIGKIIDQDLKNTNITGLISVTKVKVSPDLTVTILSVVWHWNDTFLSTMFLSKDYPLSVALSRIGSKNIGDMYDPKTTGIVFAGCLLVILPMLILYCILQRQFIKSIDRVGIVG